MPCMARTWDPSFDAVVTAAPATRMLVPQFLAVGRDPEFGWPTIAKMLAEVPAGNTSKVDELAGTSAAFMNMASDDPWLRAGKNALIPGVLCADWGPQQDYAAFTAAAEALTRQAPRFAWRFWDATPVAHGPRAAGWSAATLCFDPPRQILRRKRMSAFR